MNRTKTTTILCIIILVLLLGAGGFCIYKFKDDIFKKDESENQKPV